MNKYYVDTTNLIIKNNKIDWTQSIKNNKSIFYYKNHSSIFEIKLIRKGTKNRKQIVVGYLGNIYTTTQQSLLNGYIDKIVNHEIREQQKTYSKNKYKYSVYSHINMINQKIYIGITSMCPYLRWKNGKGYIDQVFYRAIEKYGWNNFQHIVLFDNLSKEEAEIIEYELIKKYKSNDPQFGYNISNGGETNKVSESTRRKISFRQKGMKLSKEWIENRTKSQTGLKRSKITCQRISDEESIQVISISSTGKTIYKSITEASRITNISMGHISQCCNKKRNFAGKTACGEPLHWMFYYEYIERGYNELQNDKIIPQKINVGRRGISIINKQTNEVYKSIRSASIKTGIKQEKIKEDLVSSSINWEYANPDMKGDVVNI